MKRRKERPERELPLDVYKPDGVDFGEPAPVADWSHRPDDAAEQAELHAVLEEALATVPPELRIVVLLRDVEGLTTQETAEVLELGVSAVKMRLHRARLALREHLAHYSGMCRIWFLATSRAGPLGEHRRLDAGGEGLEDLLGLLLGEMVNPGRIAFLQGRDLLLTQRRLLSHGALGADLRPLPETIGRHREEQDHHGFPKGAFHASAPFRSRTGLSSLP